MNTRLEQFMRAENLNSAKLAEILQIQPSSISHLLSGRNKPSFDFISKLLSMFPELNPHWIINGKGEMYASQTPHLNDVANEVTKLTFTSPQQANIFDNEIVPSLPDVNAIADNASENSSISAPTAADASAAQKTYDINPKTVNAADRTAEKIVVFYPDNTFELFNKR